MPIIYTFIVGVNWVDILIGCLIIRGALVGKKSGLIPEIFRFIVVICATVIALHYYSRLGKFLVKQIIVLDASGDLFAFGIIIALILGFSQLVEEGWIIILKGKIHELVDQWGGFLFGFISNSLICSLILIALMLSRVDYLRSCAANSLFGLYLKDAAVEVYKTGYEGIFKKVSSDEPFNISVVGLGIKETLKEIDQ